MTSYVVAAVLLGFVLFLTAVQRRQSLGVAPARKGRFESRPPLTRKEQAMYLRLAEAFPPRAKTGRARLARQEFSGAGDHRGR
jgi:hypothetical protein